MNNKMLVLILGLGIAGFLVMDAKANAEQDLAALEAEVRPSEVMACEEVKEAAADMLEGRYLGQTREEQLASTDRLFLNMITVEAFELPTFDGQANRDVQIEAFSSKWQEKCLSNPEVTK